MIAFGLGYGEQSFRAPVTRLIEVRWPHASRDLEQAILRKMATQHPNASLILDFHHHQNRFYAGGEQAPAGAMLAEEVAWHVPGRSAIAGDYLGRDEVLCYFAARRELAHSTFRITVRRVLADNELVVIFAGGQVQRDGERLEWEIVSVFRISEGKIAECWVLPCDQYAFDDIWA